VRAELTKRLDVNFWIDGRRTGRSKGATAEKAVPFPSDCPSILVH